MNPEILLYHLRELGISVLLADNGRSLDLEAPKGVLTSELTELIREHKDDLMEMVYAEAEREAIETEGCHRTFPQIEMAGDRSLIETYGEHSAVLVLCEELMRRGGGVIEFRKAA